MAFHSAPTVTRRLVEAFGDVLMDYPQGADSSAIFPPQHIACRP